METESSTAQDGPFVNYVAPDGTFRDGWADALPDALKETAGTVAKYSSLPDVFADLHRLKTSTDGVTIPRDLSQAKPEQLTELRMILGVPEKAESYGLHQAPEGYQGQWDGDYGKKVAEVFNRHHVPAPVAKEIAALEAERAQAKAHAEEVETQQYIEAELGKLKAAWGDKLEENVGKAKITAEKLGVDLDAISDANIAQVFLKLHGWISEDNRVRTAMGLPDGALAIVAENPRSAAQDIIMNPANPRHRLYHNGDNATIKMVEEMYIRASQQK